MKSGDKYSLELSAEAYDDLIHIQSYTFTEFRESQMKKYERLLNDAFKHILLNPDSGHIRQDVPIGYQCWNVGEHVIIYRVQKSSIYVVRVLHGKMNFFLNF